jgi:hypothetical protein
MILSAAIEQYGGHSSLVIRTSSGMQVFAEQRLIGFNHQCWVIKEGGEILVYDEAGNLRFRRGVDNEVIVASTGIIIRESYGVPFVMDPFTGDRLWDLVGA